MSPALLEDSDMYEAPPLSANTQENRQNVLRGVVNQQERQQFPSQRSIGPDPQIPSSFLRSGLQDPSNYSGDNLSDGIDHLKIQTASRYSKLSPEQFLYRRKSAAQRKNWSDRHSRALPRASLQTGLCYDVRMRFHATLDEEDVHPEDPRRIHVIYQAIVGAGLTKLPEEGDREDELMLRIKAREVTKEEVLLVHTEDHWRFLTTLPDLDRKSLLDLTRTGDSIFYNNQSFTCAKLSCGGSIETCRAVWTGQVKNAIAVVRPPGHHAEPHKSMGFCLFNNVAVAASTIQQNNPECKKILILDWDVHHGNGTQSAFYDQDSVLYMSLHRFEGGTFYPPNPDGDLTFCGEGKGEGFNVNIPWATGGIGDADYIYAFQRVIMPIAYEYEPDLVIISAGFDAAAGDKIGECYVTPAGYAHMTHMLMSLARGRVAVCLEGGYNLNSISNSALAVTRTLMGEPPQPLHDVHATPKVIEVINQVIIEQSRYWKCMEYKSINKRLSADKIRAKRLHDMIRQYQARMLFDSFGMTPLIMIRPNQLISPTSEEQVLATPNYDKADTLVFVVHDSAELLAVPEPGKDTIQTHNSFVLDPSHTLLEWAVGQGFGVIDFNVPKFLTPMDETDHNQRVTNTIVLDDPNTLMLQLWDNYIDLSDATKVIFIGIGEAYKNLLNLISLRDCANRVVACVSFIARMPLCAVNNTRDENIGHWYLRHSQIFVSETHDVWSQTKRLKVKYGTLVSVSEDDLDSLIQVAYSPAINFIQKKLSQS
ncbi:Histone deacetylase hda1 [Orbilia ellipsospora]|uniref:Histone deacetylase n=1 Tax=Orbilia ellipsospora TaxID=2528407 RepID=A0AAV9XNU1_9PEZI